MAILPLAPQWVKATEKIKRRPHPPTQSYRNHHIKNTFLLESHLINKVVVLKSKLSFMYLF